MRRAIVNISCEMISECASVIRDAGLKIVGSLAALDHDCVSLIVEDASSQVLPEECDPSPFVVVRMIFTQEAYGKQRMTRLSEIRVDGHTIMDSNGRVSIERRAA